MSDAENLIHYYQQLYIQAPQHAEAFYDATERADEAEELAERMGELAEGRDVLEIACGSGYWTAALAASADAVLATDVCAGALALAEARVPDAVFACAAAEDLPGSLLEEQGIAPSLVFAGMWWPHVPRQLQDQTLARWRTAFGRDTHVALIGETYVEGLSTNIARTDAHGNTFQIHTLPDGSRHDIIYNFPTDSALRKRMAPALRDMRVERFDHFWLVTGRLK